MNKISKPSKSLIPTQNTSVNVSTLTTPELRAALAQAIGITAQSLARMAEIWVELEARGEDLSDLRGGLLTYMPSIASGRLLPELVVRCAGQATLLKMAADLSLEAQRELLEQGARVVDVTADGEIAEKRLPVETLSAAQARLAIAGESLRPPADQARLLGRQAEVKMPTQRGTIVKVRLTAAQYQALRERARAVGKTTPTFARDLLTEGSISST